MKKKFRSLFVAFVTLALLLTAACSSNSGTSSSNGASSNNTGASSSSSGRSNAEGKTIVQFWHSMGGNNGTYIDEMVAAYNESQDEIEVVATFQGNYQETLTKVQQAVPAGTAPDISMIERAFIPLLAEAGVVEDLYPWLESTGMSEDDFVAGLMGNVKFNGELNALPFNRSLPLLHINKSMLDEVGMDIPTTWDELDKVANALVIGEDGNYTRYGYSMGYASWYPIAMIVQQGGKFYNDEGTGFGFNEEGKMALKFMKDMQKTGALYYPPNTDAGNIISSMFASGQVGMIMESTGLIGRFAGEVDFEYTAAFLPAGEKYGAPTGGANLVMFKDSKVKEAAWDFLHWVFNDPQGGVQFIIKSGYMPFTYAMAEEPAMKEHFEKVPAARIAFDQLEYAIDTNNHESFAEVDALFLKAIEAIMYDDADIDSTIDAFLAEGTQIIEQYNM